MKGNVNLLKLILKALFPKEYLIKDSSKQDHFNTLGWPSWVLQRRHLPRVRDQVPDRSKGGTAWLLPKQVNNGVPLNKHKTQRAADGCKQY